MNRLVSRRARGVVQATVVVLALAGCRAKVEAPTAQIDVLNEGMLTTATTVLLDGSGSADAADNADLDLDLTLAYAWSFVDSPPDSYAELNRTEQISASFEPDVPGTYVVGLRVDNGYEESLRATATVVIEDCGVSAPVVDAVAATPASPILGEAIQLAATVSDADNGTECGMEQGMDLHWRLLAAPAGSTVALADPTSLAPSFVADVAGDYRFAVTAFDDTGLASAPAELVVTVSECGGAIPSVDAVAVAPTAPLTGDAVVLDVTVSDADNASCGLTQALAVASTFVQRPAGSLTSLAPSEGIQPSFVADVPGTYVIRTSVVDDTGLEAFVETSVTVDTCGSQDPVAELAVLSPVASGPSGSLLVADPVFQGEPVWLDASASTDPDLDPNGCNMEGALTYEWTFLSLPRDSTTRFNDPQIVNPTFDADQPGTYEIQLRVSDGAHHDYAYLQVVALPVLLNFVEPGFTIDVVDGGGPLWDRPEGIAVGPNGEIWVAQNNADMVTETVGSATRVASIGGRLANPHDLAWSTDAQAYFVTTSGNDEVVRISPTGAQDRWSQSVGAPRGIVAYTTPGGSPRLAISDAGNDVVRIFDPTDGVGATPVRSEDFGGNLNNPWGVEAANRSGQETLWTTNTGDDTLWRTDGNTDRELAGFLDRPRDVARAPSGSLVVADSNSGFLYAIEDCTNGPCPATVIAAGQWEPWGLAFEPAGTLLVTDRNGDALLRVTGPF